MIGADLVHKFQKFTSDNSPTILTVLGVTGVGLTAVLTARASFQASLILEDMHAEYDEYQHDEPWTIDPREAIEKLWKLYIPAAGVGVMTAACIIGSNRIGTRRAAAMASAFAISERAFDEYKTKVVEKLGEKKERAVRDEIAQDRMTAQPMGTMVIGDGKVPCYDAYSGRYWPCTMEDLKKAQNDINYKILNQNYASLNDFYDLVGLGRNKTGEEVGWSLDTGKLEIRFSTTMTDKQEPAISIDFGVAPIRRYWKNNP